MDDWDEGEQEFESEEEETRKKGESCFCYERIQYQCLIAFR